MTSLHELVDELYAARADTWEAARRNAETFVKQATHLADPDDRYLYSVTSRIKRRIRAVTKIEGKLRKNSIREPHDLKSTEDSISDWVGVKVACNTDADAKALISIIQENCGKPHYPKFAKKLDGTDDIEDYVNNPKPSGYRAYHAVILFHSFDDAKICEVRAEIQIKTRLQDAWGELTHDTLYKSHKSDENGAHAGTAKSMAEMLVAVDKLATELAKDMTYDSAMATDGVEPPAESTGQISENAEDELAIVTVFHLDKRYALARDGDGEVGLIRALWVRDLLAAEEKIEPSDRIDVDDYLTMGQKFLAHSYEDNDSLFFEPISLDDPYDMETDPGGRE